MSDPAPSERPPPSPCLGICIMDPRTRQCRGCLRTIDEIAGWWQATTPAKHAIIAALAERRAVAAAEKAGNG